MSSRLSYRASIATDNGLRVQPEMFKHRLLQLGEETLGSLQNIWNEAGYDEAECQRLLGEFLNKVKSTCATELDAEQQILEHAKAEAVANAAEFRDYCEKLGRQCNIDYIDNMNYTEKLAELEKLIGSISDEVNQRQKLLDTEMSRISNLIDSLGEQQPDADQFNGPDGTPKLSDVRLQLMREYAGDLESIKEKRTDDVKTIIKDCHKHMTDLMYVEENLSTMEDSEQYREMDQKIDRYFKSDEFDFSLHKKDIAALTMRLKSFADEKERRRAELATVGADIAKLWTLLRIPSAERERFQNSFKMNLSMETLNKGHEELARLKEIRSTQMTKVVGTIRGDILALWEEAGIEDERDQKAEFPMYFEDIEKLEDSAVELHEEYFSVMRKRVEELRPLLQKIARREAIVQERIELEHLMMKPERLNNRGPSAREERKKEEGMSNRVRNLDKVTKELLSQISTWEENNKSRGPFVYGGERYEERVAKQDAEYIEIRDALRAERKKNNGKHASTDADTTLSATALHQTKTTAPLKKQTSVRGAAGTATPSSATRARAAAAAASSTVHDLPVVPAGVTVTNAAINAAVAAMPPPPARSQPLQVQGKTGLPLLKTRSGSIVTSGAPAVVSDENAAPMARNSEFTMSRDSDDGTMVTSATHVKERPLSNGSHTVVRES